MKRIFSILLCIALCFGLCVPVLADDMNDTFSPQDNPEVITIGDEEYRYIYEETSDQTVVTMIGETTTYHFVYDKQGDIAEVYTFSTDIATASAQSVIDNHSPDLVIDFNEVNDSGDIALPQKSSIAFTYSEYMGKYYMCTHYDDDSFELLYNTSPIAFVPEHPGAYIIRQCRNYYKTINELDMHIPDWWESFQEAAVDALFAKLTDDIFSYSSLKNICTILNDSATGYEQGQAYLAIAAGLIASKFAAPWVPTVVGFASVATPMLWIHEDIWEMENIYTYVYGVYN